MKKFLSKIPFIRLVAAVFSFNIVIILAIFLFQKKLPPQVPLFFGKPQGEEQLVPWVYLIIPPALSALITLINTFLLKVTKDHLLQKVLLASTFLVTALSSSSVFQIVRLVGNLF